MEYFEWYDWIHEIMFQTNSVLLSLIGLAFFWQFLFMIFFFLKKKIFPKSKKKNRIAILIPARNEESVIRQTILDLKNKQKYPKNKFDIYVVADNCTDNTAEVATLAGANVFIHKDNDPKHHKKAYALQYGFRKMLELGLEYDFVIMFDADNKANEDYLSLMNDAFNSGVKIARPCENSLNLDQNVWSKISGLYYLRDSRFACRVRERLHLNPMLTGAGMMVSYDIITKINGWDCMSESEDAEFTVKRIMDGYRVHYVEDAQVFEDQPSSLKDTFVRNERMGHGLHKLFWTGGFKMFFKFFISFKISYIDLFLQLFFIPMAVLCCTWIPIYYVFDFFYCLFLRPTAENLLFLQNEWIVIGYALLFAFYIAFVFQGTFILITQRKNVRIKNTKSMIPAIFMFPFFMIIYCLAIFLGVVKKPKWKQVKRNTKYTNS
ncbi:MAG: glycosyltransferase family 2 protein [Bacilli bacterium]